MLCKGCGVPLCRDCHRFDLYAHDCASINPLILCSKCYDDIDINPYGAKMTGIVRVIDLISLTLNAERVSHLPNGIPLSGPADARATGVPFAFRLCPFAYYRQRTTDIQISDFI